jgi:2-amino-4-hydroxy-6-hydroxymethyldihydropteridine diphosphokinase
MALSPADDPLPPAAVFVALGSNLGHPAVNVRRAMDRLRRLSDRPLRRSSLWLSDPVDCPPGSPPFVNAVVELTPRADETPETLLRKLQALEAKFGRQPAPLRNAPRPLDLDLISFGGHRRAGSALTLPHPRAVERRFVLAPLAEIAPDLVLPGQAKSVGELLKGLGSSQSVRRLTRDSRGPRRL